MFIISKKQKNGAKSKTFAQHIEDIGEQRLGCCFNGLNTVNNKKTAQILL
jgi:hypothetical protein